MENTIEIRVRTLAALAAALLVGVAATLVGTAVWPAAAAPGDLDATYVPTLGCRVTDTRAATNVGPRTTPLGADDTMTVPIHGDNGECTGSLAIPTDAVGVALNVTAVGATAASNVRVYPAELATPPLLSNLNVFPGAPPTPNKVDVKLSPDGAIKVYNFRGAVQIVIDVVGYYTPDSLRELAAGPGAAGPQGPRGPRGLSAWDVIPSGTTVTGNFVFSGIIERSNDNRTYGREVTLPGVAPVPIVSDDVRFAPAGGVSQPEPSCTGTAIAPTAPAGKVCLYVASSNNAQGFRAFQGVLADRGFEVVWSADGSNSVGQGFRLSATWAYTAP